MASAENIYQTLCRTLDNSGIRYSKNLPTMSVHCQFAGDGVTYDFAAGVDAEKEYLIIWIGLPFSVEKDYLAETAIAICRVNNLLAVGAFGIDKKDLSLIFRVPTHITGVTFENDYFVKAINAALASVSAYHADLYAISRGNMSLETFSKKYN